MLTASGPHRRASVSQWTLACTVKVLWVVKLMRKVLHSVGPLVIHPRILRHSTNLRKVSRTKTSRSPSRATEFFGSKGARSVTWQMLNDHSRQLTDHFLPWRVEFRMSVCVWAQANVAEKQGTDGPWVSEQPSFSNSLDVKGQLKLLYNCLTVGGLHFWLQSADDKFCLRARKGTFLILSTAAFLPFCQSSR